MIRAFIGLELPQEIRSQLVLQQYLMPVKRRLPPEYFHITLVFLGNATHAQLDELDQELGRLHMPDLQLEIAGLGLFGKGRAHNLHAQVRLTPELAQLHQKLTNLVRRAGFEPEPRRYIPHVTLSYLTPGSFDQAELELAVARDAQFRAGPFAAHHIALFRSHLRRSGAEYDVLERYPLSAVGRAVKQ